MAPPTILLQFDIDRHASTFDAVVAVDAGVESLLQYSQVTAEGVTPLVHGAMFTRGGDALTRTAIFIGGSDVAAAEVLLQEVRNTFFGPVRVSVMFDANGCNTTAAAAVLSAMRHADIRGATAAVLGGTGPVGLRVARLLAGSGCRVRLASRSESRAAEAVQSISSVTGHQLITPVASSDPTSVAAAIDDCDLVFACGAAGVELLDAKTLEAASRLRVAVDLNAVPPAGIESVDATDRGRQSNGRHLYGAIGVGGLKMKIHKAAIGKLFERNDQVLDAEEMFAIGKSIAAR